MIAANFQERFFTCNEDYILATGLCSDKHLLTTYAIMHMLVTRDNHKSIKMRPTNVDLESLVAFPFQRSTPYHYSY